MVTYENSGIAFVGGESSAVLDRRVYINELNKSESLASQLAALSAELRAQDCGIDGEKRDSEGYCPGYNPNDSLLKKLFQSEGGSGGANNDGGGAICVCPGVIVVGVLLVMLLNSLNEATGKRAK